MFQHSGYYLGSDPLQRNHTQPVEMGTEVQSAAAERATQGLSFGDLRAPRPQTNTGNPTQSCAGSVLHIDFSCMLVSSEVRLAFRDLLHPSLPTHWLPARASLAVMDPWIGSTGHRRREGRQEPMAMMMSCTGSLSSVIYQPSSSLPNTHPCFHLKKGKMECFTKSHLWHSASLRSMQMQM